MSGWNWELVLLSSLGWEEFSELLSMSTAEESISKASSASLIRLSKGAIFDSVIELESSSELELLPELLSELELLELEEYWFSCL